METSQQPNILIQSWNIKDTDCFHQFLWASLFIHLGRRASTLSLSKSYGVVHFSPSWVGWADCLPFLWGTPSPWGWWGVCASFPAVLPAVYQHRHSLLWTGAVPCCAIGLSGKSSCGGGPVCWQGTGTSHLFDKIILFYLFSLENYIHKPNITWE